MALVKIELSLTSTGKASMDFKVEADSNDTDETMKIAKQLAIETYMEMRDYTLTEYGKINKELK